ncbi:MAG: anaerobic ribonucleoside-triphosphate reductase activating protein [Acutalibacteraceae bacterium]|nr:anaerobic ribonucleoside-triphosphate reductase activating protein [Acutalibacteraceae bacterium]
MHYGEIKTYDIANGPGVRVTLFVSGCTNACKNCFQPQTWDFHYGQEFDDSAKERIFTELSHIFTQGLTLLGGDPFEPANQRALVPFLREVREKFPGKDIWAFTGFLYEDLLTEGTYCHTEVSEEMLSLCDVLVDGRFEEDLKDITLRFRGSSNQRLIDLSATRETGEIVLWDDGGHM